MANKALAKQLREGRFIVAPGVFDLISALMARQHRFDAIYVSGYWCTASYLGIPDAGLSTLTDMLNRVERIAAISDRPVIADADTGFGGLLNVHHTVRGYEQAGVTAIQLEDQEFPKKCGHTPYRRVVKTPEMVAKIKVALDARKSEDFLIIARTDSRTGLGFDEALERGHRFAEAGADLVFLESLETEEEMRRACAEIQAPLIANVANGGLSPILKVEELQGLGYAAAIFPAMAPLAAIHAVNSAYEHLAATGNSVNPATPHFDFMDFCRILGFQDVWDFEEKWKEVLDPDG